MTPSRTLTVRTPEDVLALVVSVLGFHPADSVVIVTRTDSASFHARADLPPAADGAQAVAGNLAEAAAMNDAREAIVVTYSADPLLAHAMTHALIDALTYRDIAVDLTFRAHGSRWYRTGDAVDGEGTAYDLAAHPFILESRFCDREIYRDREQLAASLRGPEEEIAKTERAMKAVAPHLLEGSSGDPGDWAAAVVDHQVGWARERLAGEAELSPEDIARLALGLGLREIRDGVWMAMDRPSAEAWRRRLKEVVRATPDDLVAEPAGLLAFASWLSGDGALAWCAVELAQSVDPSHTLASLVAQALEAAVPPSTWDPPGLGTEPPEAA